MKKFWLPLTLIMASILPAPMIVAADMPVPAVQSHRGDNGNQRQQGEKKFEHNKGGNQHGHGNNNNRPGNNDKPKDHNKHHGNDNKHHGNDNKRPGNTNGNHRPGTNGNQRPGGNHSTPLPPPTRPGGNNRPGHNHGTPPPPPVNHRPGNNHGTSLPRPGNNAHYSHSHWHPLPPPPPRPQHIHHYHNVRPSFLGLTLGTLFDVGLNSLINGGFNVVYAADNVMGLTNVNQFGVLWPDACFFYGPAGMTGARFQYLSSIWDDRAFNTAYGQLNSIYGQPESVTRTRNSLSAVWWTGGNSYVTLSCTAASNGLSGYATELIFGN